MQYTQGEAEYVRAFGKWRTSKSGEPPPWKPVEPIYQRYIVSDITIEALAERLADQFDGVVAVHDELAGWVDGIAEYKGGKGSDTDHWLAAWSGAPWTVDCKGGPKFALLFQLVRWAAGTASDSAADVESIRAAITLSDWFGGEARRIYTMLGESDDEHDQPRLVDWISGKGGEVTSREVQMGCRWLRAAGAALGELVKAGWGC